MSNKNTPKNVEIMALLFKISRNATGCRLLARHCVDLLIIRLLIKPSSILLKHHVAGDGRELTILMFSTMALFMTIKLF